MEASQEIDSTDAVVSKEELAAAMEDRPLVSDPISQQKTDQTLVAPPTHALSPPKAVTPKKTTGTNGSAKPGIAAAIAAFEKNAGDRTSSPASLSIKKPNNAHHSSGLKSPSAVRPPGASKQPSTTDTPTLQTQQLPAADGTVPPSHDTALPASAKVATPARVSKQSSDQPVGATTNRAAALANARTLNNPSNGASKATARLSTAPKPTAAATGLKPSVRQNSASVLTSARVKSPPESTKQAPTAARRQSAIITTSTNVTKAPLKAPTPTMAATRKLTVTTGAKPIGGATPLPNKRASVGPGISRTLPSNNSAATAALESKLSRAESELAEKTESLTNLETRLEALTQESDLAQQRLRDELEALQLKLQDQVRSPLAEVSGPTTSEAETAQLELEAAQARVTELTQAVEGHDRDQARLAAQQVESLGRVSQLEETVNLLTKQIEEATREKDTAMSELSQKHKEELDLIMGELRGQFEAEAQVLRQRALNAETNYQRTKDEATADTMLSDELAKGSEENSKKHADALAELEAAHCLKVEAVIQEHEEANRSMRESLESALAQARTELSESEAKAHTSTEELREKYSAELAAALAEAKRQAEQLHQVDLNSLKEEHEEKLVQLQNDCVEIKQLQARLEQERDDLQSQVDKLFSEKRELEDRLVCELAALKTEHASHIEKEYQRAKDELGETHIEQLRTFRQQSQETTEQLMLSHQAEMESIKASLSSDSASQQALLEAELSQLRLEVQALRSDLATSRAADQEHAAQVTHLTAELEKVRGALAESAAHVSQQTSDSNENRRLRTELEHAREEAEENRTLLKKTQMELNAEFEHARERHSDEVNRHVEEKALLKEELGRIKLSKEADSERLQINQTLVEELGQTIEQEISKREALENELKRFKAQDGVTADRAGVTEEKLTELHEAHNAKIRELAHEREKMSESLRMEREEKEEFRERMIIAEEKAEEMEFKCRMLEATVENEKQGNATGNTVADFTGKDTMNLT